MTWNARSAAGIIKTKFIRNPVKGLPKGKVYFLLVFFKIVSKAHSAIGNVQVGNLMIVI